MMLGHYVFFSLHDASADAVETLIASGKTLLAPLDGIVFFGMGSRTGDLIRPVNDTQFDVGLQIVFTDRQAHDRYQELPNHLKFIEQNRENWSQIRVFDIDLAEVPPSSPKT